MKYKKAVDSFIRYLNVDRGYSQLTIREYKSDLNLFYRYLREEYKLAADFTIDRIDRIKVAEFLSDLILNYNDKAVTRNRKLYSLRSFFKYLIKFDYLETDPTSALEASKTRQNAEPIYLKLDDAQRYIRAIRESQSINKYRDLAIVKIFLYAGLRVSELVALNMEDIDFDDQSIKFYGKGNKERYVPLHGDIIQAIRDYLPERKEITPSSEDARRALFLSRQGNRISARSIQIFVKKYAKKAGVTNAEKITPHKLRHTFATLLYRKTKDIKVLQDLLGHSNISTTQIYTHTDTEQKKGAIEEFPDL